MDIMNRKAIKQEIEKLEHLDWSLEIQDKIDFLKHQLDHEMSVPRYLKLEHD